MKIDVTLRNGTHKVLDVGIGEIFTNIETPVWMQLLVIDALLEDADWDNWDFVKE